jgi:hypothetical protein
MTVRRGWSTLRQAHTWDRDGCIGTSGAFAIEKRSIRVLGVTCQNPNAKEDSSGFMSRPQPKQIRRPFCNRFGFAPPIPNLTLCNWPCPHRGDTLSISCNAYSTIHLSGRARDNHTGAVSKEVLLLARTRRRSIPASRLVRLLLPRSTRFLKW